jgi:hypothetical protein
MAGNYPAGVTDNDPHFDLPSVEDEGEEALAIPCCRCGRRTTWDPIYNDLCYRCCRAENE